MTTIVDQDTLPAFRDWLLAKRPLGLATNAAATSFAVADTKKAWTVLLDDDQVARAAVAAIAHSGRKVWADTAVVPVLAIAKSMSIPISEFSWIYDASTAYAVANPGEEPVVRPRGADRAALSVARSMTAAAVETSPSVRAATMPSIALEQAVRERQAKGWRVDVVRLNEERAANREATIAATREDGVDLTATYSEKDKAAATGWLARFGITLTGIDGKPSLSRDDFDRVDIPDSPEARYAWKRFRAAASRRSARLSLDQIHKGLVGDRIYSRIIIRGARTGRGKMTSPNLTALARVYRGVILADEGMTFLSLDLDRVEPSVGAALSGDAAMTWALTNSDVYVELAVAIQGEGARTDPDARSEAKISLLSILYGRGAGGLSARLGISKSQASTIIGAIWRAYPQLAEFSRACRTSADDKTQLFTPSGRPLPFPRKGAYQMLNTVLQGTASDVFYGGVSRLVEALGSGSSVALLIHDEVILEVPNADAFRVAAIMQTTMSSVLNDLQIGGETKILGPRWGK